MALLQRRTRKPSKEVILAACELVKEKDRSRRITARLRGIPVSTFCAKINRRKPKSNSQSHRTVLSPEDEEMIVHWVAESAKSGIIRTRQQILTAVQSHVHQRRLKTPFKNNKPGRHWFLNFMKRHKELSQSIINATDKPRISPTLGILVEWFETMFREITSVDADVLNDPSRIYNCCVSGFKFWGDITQVLNDDDTKDEQKEGRTMDGSDQINVLACGNALGDVHPPLLIFPGQQLSFYPLTGFPKAVIAQNKRGLMNSDIFYVWLENTFVPAIKDLDKPVILFAGGDKVRYTSTASKLCKDHNILLYQFPNHTEHLSQPMDLTAFTSLREAWREEVKYHLGMTSDRMTKKDFSKIFMNVWKRSIESHIIQSRFKAAGIYPWIIYHTNIIEAKSGPSHLLLASTDLHKQITKDPSPISLSSADNSTAPSSHNNANLLPLINSSQDKIHVPTTFDQKPEIVQIEHTPYLTTYTPSSESNIGTSCFDQDNAYEEMSFKTLTSQITLRQALDRLMDITAVGGINRLIHYRTLHDLNIQQTDDPEGYLFHLLYTQILKLLDESQTLGISPLYGEWEPKPKCDVLIPNSVGPADLNTQKYINETEEEADNTVIEIYIKKECDDRL